MSVVLQVTVLEPYLLGVSRGSALIQADRHKHLNLTWVTYKKYII